MELPWNCSSCGSENLIDLASLSEWPVDKVTSAQGFTCEECGAREVVSYRTASLEAAERKLTRYHPGQPQFDYLFRRLVRKAEGVNARGEHHGAFQRENLAPS